MRNLKLLSLSAVLAVVVTMFSSCLNSDFEIPSDPFWVTVENSLGTKILKDDKQGYTFIPTNPSLLRDFKRARVRFLITDDVVIKREGVNKLAIDPYTSFGIDVKDIILTPPLPGTAGDTLRNDSVAYFALVDAYNDCVTTIVTLKEISSYYIDLVKEKIANDTIYFRLNLNLKEGNYFGGNFYNSFIMPSGEVLKQEGIVPQGDSIVVAVSAKVYNGYKNEVKTNYSKYKLE